MAGEDIATWLARLPPAVAERVRVVRGGPPAAGRYVLYWLRTAMRGSENPALDAALALAHALGLPAFVYQALSERYPHASDRHHVFVLEGARDLAAALARRGVGYAFHLSRPGHRGRHLESLARRAAVVVTEDMPVMPLAAWTAVLARRVTVPLVAVDAACVVPMRLVGRRFSRAVAFRRATTSLRQARLRRPWHDVVPRQPPYRPPDLPFAPIDLESADLAALVARCEIDHGVAPVAHARGGSRAGYARWRAFRDGKLAAYERARDDPLAEGTSRMSAYLRYGMVSPLRLAREAAEEGSDGAHRFLDQLVIRRELAYNLCFYEPRHATAGALPAWALATLSEHREDPRPALPSWETLARSRSGDPLWDAAQNCLRIHGELHHDLRRTWGKALLAWTADPESALALLLDLNDRFALDGRGPASYGGALGCLGLDEQPCEPPRPIYGTVPARPTAEHARRLDLPRFAARAARPSLKQPPRVAVVGAGMAGLTCARVLVDHGLEVTAFDRGRFPGGRLATYRAGDLACDLGAQYFTQRDPRFAPFVRSWLHDRLIAPWPRDASSLGRDDGAVERYVGVPSMDRLARHLAADLTLVAGDAVVALERKARRWSLRLASGEVAEAFDAVALAMPAPRARPLLAPIPELQERLATVAMAPCLALIVAFDEPLIADLEPGDLEGTPFAWVARDGGKPERDPAAEIWVLHATAAWSTTHLEAPREAVVDALLAAFAGLVGGSLPRRRHLALHRWRYARTLTPLGEDCLFDAARGAGVCGDWCLGARLEAAFLSGTALAGRLLGAAAQHQREAGEAAQLPLFAQRR